MNCKRSDNRELQARKRAAAVAAVGWKCKKCGNTTERYDDGKCKPCVIARVRRYATEIASANREGYAAHRAELRRLREAGNHEAVEALRAKWNEAARAIRNERIQHRREANREHYNEQTRLRRERNRARARELGRALYHGISVDEMNALLGSHGGSCDCCGEVLRDASHRTGKNLDHDHATGRFRGILCGSCNTGIGKLGDNIEGLRRALAYLERTTEPAKAPRRVGDVDPRQIPLLDS